MALLLAHDSCCIYDTLGLLDSPFCDGTDVKRGSFKLEDTDYRIDSLINNGTIQIMGSNVP
jgi:hypothetical protein